ncbi:MAG: alanine racemase [Firmicutes bacterium]|nr:alanine racemase [Bacillota bacterium]
MQNQTIYRAAAIIDLAALEENVRNIRSCLKPGVKLTAVVKADAYGHGMAGLYPVLKRCGVERYAVAFWQEGMHLREEGVTEPILILGDTMEEDMAKVLEQDLIPAVFTMSMAEGMNAAAKLAGKKARIHIKLDTGMGRIGFPCTEEAIQQILRISKMENLEIEGIFSHFARADEVDKTHAREQYERYHWMIERLAEEGVEIPLRHIDNSAGIMELGEAQEAMARAGIILYGLYPSHEVDRSKLKLKPVLSWISHVSFVKEVPAGTPISYGGTFVTQRPSVIATVPVGYADGYSRNLSNKGKVLIHGKEAPICGRVCMDQFMVDVTDIEGVKRGDQVTLLGGSLTADWMADLLGTINYEVVCDISVRVPRIYVTNFADPV